MRRTRGNQDKQSLFRGWSRLCLHAASLSAADVAPAPITAVARGSRAVAMGVEAAAENGKGIEAWETAAVTTKRAVKANAEAEEAGSLLREKGRQRAKRVVRDNDTCFFERG